MAYDRDSYSRIQKEYETKHKNAIADAENRLAEIHAQHPDIKSIDAQLRMTGIKLMQEAMKGKVGIEERIEAVQKENLALQAERATLLKKYSLPEDYTDPKYECTKCNDSGFVGINMCSCFKSALAKCAFENSGLGALLKDQSFDTFDMSFYMDDKTSFEKMQKNVEICKNYAESFDNSGNNLIFIGGTGLGKTHLSTSIARKVIEKGFEVVYDSAPNVFNDFNKEQFKDEQGLTQKYFDCDLFILDDLGTEMHTAFTVSCLYNVINTRLNTGKSTIINTNLSIDELRKMYTDRITSRVFGCFTPLLFTGKDIRMQKLQRNM
ncbi:MAG: ATP-binding protein [Clostridia bacterium]|nr:ATP-binding protein [Clostridia bacterium]